MTFHIALIERINKGMIEVIKEWIGKKAIPWDIGRFYFRTQHASGAPYLFMISGPTFFIYLLSISGRSIVMLLENVTDFLGQKESLIGTKHWEGHKG